MTHELHRKEDIAKAQQYIRRHGSFTKEQKEILALLDAGKDVEEVATAMKYPSGHGISYKERNISSLPHCTPLYATKGD